MTSSYTRPPHYPYSFQAFKDVPRRLFYPPRSEIKIGRVRSISLTPLFEVKLADVLDGQHLPPLSRKDFEEYLLFVEHSPENLYFIQWFTDYAKAYNAWTQTGTPYSTSLALSWSRAKQTFLANDAHYKLNLSEASLEGVPNSPEPAQQPQPVSSAAMSQEPSQSSQDRPAGPSYPNPIALTKMKSEVEDMLRESLNRFVTGSCGNSGRARGLFGITLGVITLAVGLAPVLVSILQGRGGRGLRAAAIPIFWLGAWITIMSLHGVCIVIFLFGDARQLYPYELARPKITSPIAKPAMISSPEAKSHDSEKSGDPANQVHLHVDLEQGHMGSCSSASTVGKQSRYYSASSVGHGDRHSRGQSCELKVMASPQTVAVSPTSAHNLIQQPNTGTGTAMSPQPWSFDFDALPASTSNQAANPDQWGSTLPTRPDEKFRSIPTFGPLTKVLSPIITRAQWVIVIRSAILAVVVAAILGAICLAVPARR